MKFIKNLMGVLALLSLGVTDVSFSQGVAPEKTQEIRHAVYAWLECEECTEGQLESVVKLGGQAVPSLGAALERGPSPASLERVQLHLEDSHRRLVEYARTHPETRIPLDEASYVRLYLDNYRALHGVRAARALGEIGGEAARKHLQGASKLKLRADVQAVVRESLARLAL